MKRIRRPYYMLFSLLALLVAALPVANAQDVPARIDVTWVDTSQFPQIQVHLVAWAASGSRYGGLFVDALQLFEDSTARHPSMYDAPVGTSVTFLIVADQVAETHWDEVRQAIESYVSLTENWMDEDLDVATIVVATGDEWTPLVEDTPFRNDVINAFITETGAYYQPSFKPLTPLYDLVSQTLSRMPAQTPKPGMYRALVVLSSGDPGASTATPEAIAAEAKEIDVSLYTVSIGDSPAGQQIMEQLADVAGGQYTQLAADQTLIPLWQMLSSHHQQYVISYRSGIVASGTHNVKVQITDRVSDSSGFDITVLDPAVEITLPETDAIILRKPTESSTDPADYEPKTQAIKYLWTWPDGFERQINTVQLRVNGAVQQQLDLTATDDRNLVWDLAGLQPGRYSLRVEVVDELGMTGASPEIPVAIELFSAVPTVGPTATPAPTPGPSLVDKALTTAKRNLPWLGAGGLSLTALLASFFVLKRRASYLGKSPLGFLRSLPALRPLDRIFRSIERVAGPIGLPKAKVKKPELKAPGGVKVPGAGREKPAAAAKAGTPEAQPGIGWVDVIEGPPLPSGRVEIREETSFGRSPEQAQVVLADQTVSRHHASIMPEYGNKYRVYNHSTQHTWVNEQRVPEHGLLLEDGDEVRMGKQRLRFHITRR